MRHPKSERDFSLGDMLGENWSLSFLCVEANINQHERNQKQQNFEGFTSSEIRLLGATPALRSLEIPPEVSVINLMLIHYWLWRGRGKKRRRQGFEGMLSSFSRNWRSKSSQNVRLFSSRFSHCLINKFPGKQSPPRHPNLLSDLVFSRIDFINFLFFPSARTTCVGEG